jgi:dephospho-CoA kinase
MYLVGLTGGIGSGKSTVAARLAEHGVPVVDADQVAREIVEPGEPALDDLVAHFGERILDADGRLDRPGLAAIAFVDEEQRAALNAITHPRIGERIAARLQQLEEDGVEIAVLDHPLLLEGDPTGRVDTVVVVLAPEDVRVRRLVEQRGLDEDDVRARMRAQVSDEVRREVADHVIDNDGDLEVLQERTDALLARLRADAGLPPASAQG